MEEAGLVLAIIGAVGVLPVITGLIVRGGNYRRARRVLGFKRTLPVDIVLTTSAVESAVHGAPVTRPLTGYGQVRGVANCARALTKHYPRKDIVIHLSGFVRNRLDRDLVCLGGPAKNEETRALLREIPNHYDLPEFEFDDIGNSLRIADCYGRTVSYKNFDPLLHDGIPEVDICLLIAFTRKKVGASTTRVILCAGFTSYGTAAASEYMFLDLPKLRLKRLNDLLQSGYRPVKSRDDFIIVGNARFSRGECTNIEPVFETILKPL
jgi:hypothetical protein